MAGSGGGTTDGSVGGTGGAAGEPQRGRGGATAGAGGGPRRESHAARNPRLGSLTRPHPPHSTPSPLILYPPSHLFFTSGPLGPLLKSQHNFIIHPSPHHRDPILAYVGGNSDAVRARRQAHTHSPRGRPLPRRAPAGALRAWLTGVPPARRRGSVLQGREERPHVFRDPGARARGRAGLGRGRARIVKVPRPIDDGVAVTRLVHAPAQGMPARASGVVGADMPPGAQKGGRLRRLGRVLGGAAVVPDEPVAHRCREARSDIRCPSRPAICQ